MARGVGAVETQDSRRLQGCLQRVPAAGRHCPWLANAYRNLAIAQDKAGMYTILASLRFYLLTTIVRRRRRADDLKSKWSSKERQRRAKEGRELSAQAVTRPRQTALKTCSGDCGRRYTLPQA